MTIYYDAYAGARQLNQMSNGFNLEKLFCIDYRHIDSVSWLLHDFTLGLFRHVLEGLGQVLLAERELANSPNLGVLIKPCQPQPMRRGTYCLTAKNAVDVGTHRLQVLLQLRVQSTALECNDLGSGIWVVGNWRAALRAEEAVDGFARGSLARPLLDRAIDRELVLGDDANQS